MKSTRVPCLDFGWILRECTYVHTFGLANEWMCRPFELWLAGNSETDVVGCSEEAPREGGENGFCLYPRVD